MKYLNKKVIVQIAEEVFKHYLIHHFNLNHSSAEELLIIIELVKCQIYP